MLTAQKLTQALALPPLKPDLYSCVETTVYLQRSPVPYAVLYTVLCPVAMHLPRNVTTCHSGMYHKNCDWSAWSQRNTLPFTS